MTQNSETMAGWLLACRTESGMDYRTVIYCLESDLVGYPELIGYRLATAAEMDQAAEADFIPMIAEIHINKECWGFVKQSFRQSEKEFKEDAHAAYADLVRQAYQEYSRVNAQLSYRLAKKGVDY